MTKTVCDICNKEMPSIKFVDKIENQNFCISSYGRIWDICTECRVSLNRWMTTRRHKESEEYEIVDLGNGLYERRYKEGKDEAGEMH